ncbi:class I SAM-dependent methyltransferase [Streptomyces sp. NPDC021096]|uniref:class I SAM-dependent methyltransferase n=1 Tax=Streptomyces sp. NPDC021096 TaxID=3154792 RepID=UPI0033EBCFA2
MTTGPAAHQDAVTAEYADLNPLQVRITTHQLYSERPDNPDTAVRDHLRVPSDADLLDIGCGTGQFLHDLDHHGHTGRLTGLDTSPEAIRQTAVGRVTALHASANNLPFTDGAFDIVTARHMLYHVPDPAQALREARRVLRPGGVYAATVNHARTAPRTHDLVQAVIEDARVMPSAGSPVNAINSDTLPPLLHKAFGNVTTVRYDNALVFTRPQPLADFAVALLPFNGIPTTNPEHSWLAEEIRARAQRWFSDRPGQVWRDPKGWSLCSATSA